MFPVKLLDTSKEARDQTAEHERRLGILSEVLQAELDGAVTITGETLSDCEPETTDCLLELARDTGSERAVFVVVQKTSTLILQVFANLVNVETGELIASRDLNFRGDNDEAWRRAGRFLAKQLRGAAD
ncbi:DUF2380 domain-containing protein [Paracoccus methylarcula]|uniref:DUF2380 domain-containing protein n=1 Tax=Paracoccus methylarcula TaxID=72022 RepID=A0A422R0V2_9RHOB|nr:DUF2380 domain-containing protein [Paracoccus methylarcula]